MNILAVAFGGAVGSVIRHLLVLTFGAPWAVLAINVLGSFLIGIAFVLLAGRGILAPLVMTGILGGFTTFSAFSLDTLKLWESGHFLWAALYVGGSLILSLAAVALGATLARGFA